MPKSDHKPNKTLRIDAELEGSSDLLLLTLRHEAGLTLDGDYFVCEGCGAKTWQDTPEREEFRGDLYCIKCGVLMPFEMLREQLESDSNTTKGD